MSFHPDIKPRVLKWARDRAGLGVEALVEAFPKYQEWEAGKSSPSMGQLEALARKTGTPLGYFFLQAPPDEELPIPDYRTKGGKSIARPSSDLLTTIFAMQRRQDWVRDLLIEQGVEPLPFVGSADSSMSPGTVAIAIRQELGLEPNWQRRPSEYLNTYVALRQAAEEIGIFVVINGVVGNNTHRPLNPNEFRGFVLSDEYAPLVFVNGRDAKAAQLFTLVHEIAHIWINSDALFGLSYLQPDKSKVERFCNEVAAEFLVPASILAERWNDPSTIAEYEELARTFSVSAAVIARRATGLGLISRDNYFAFYDKYIKHAALKEAAAATRDKEKKKGGNFWNTQNTRIGRRFGRAVVQAVKEGRLRYTDARRLTGLSGKSLVTYAERLGYSI